MINIAKLLKDAPEGMKLYSPLFGEVEYMQLGDENKIWVKTSFDTYYFDKYGKPYASDKAECLLFPSKEIRTWEGWKLHVEPKFKVGDEIIWTEPKGDKPAEPVKIIQLIDKDQLYMVDMSNGVGYVAYDMQDYYKLVQKPHYDIANFHAGMPVLVRDSIYTKWLYTLFGMYNETNVVYPFVVVDMRGYAQCIPFNKDTKHLLGTTDMPSEEYINW